MSPRASRRCENQQLRLGVVAAGRLHLAVDGRSLCGRVMADERDLYGDEAGLRAWNNGPLERCAQCATALLARSRDPAPTRTAAPWPQTAARTGHQLCGNCGTISPDDWDAFTRDDQGELTPATTNDHDPIIRCPTCRYDHTDDDADPDVWAGTRAEMERERARLVRDRPRRTDEWAQVLAGNAA
jgi:hypothetical protein